MKIKMLSNFKKNDWKFAKKVNSKRAGFSLMEVMFALFVLTVGIATITKLMVSSIKTSVDATNQIVASQLVQEGIEIVRNNRDNNLATFTSIASGNYVVDYKGPGIYTDANEQLYSDGAFMRYFTFGANKTKFFRRVNINITTSGGKNTANITCYVSWNGTGIPVTCNVANKCVSAVSVLPDLN